MSNSSRCTGAASADNAAERKGPREAARIFRADEQVGIGLYQGVEYQVDMTIGKQEVRPLGSNDPILSRSIVQTPCPKSITHACE